MSGLQVNDQRETPGKSLSGHEFYHCRKVDDTGKGEHASTYKYLLWSCHFEKIFHGFNPTTWEEGNKTLKKLCCYIGITEGIM